MIPYFTQDGLTIYHGSAERLPLTLIRRIAACAFALLALYAGYQALSLAGLV